MSLWKYWNKTFQFKYRTTCSECGQEYLEGLNPYELYEPIVFPINVGEENRKLQNRKNNGCFDNLEDTSNR